MRPAAKLQLIVLIALVASACAAPSYRGTLSLGEWSHRELRVNRGARSVVWRPNELESWIATVIPLTTDGAEQALWVRLYPSQLPCGVLFDRRRPESASCPSDPDQTLVLRPDDSARTIETLLPRTEQAERLWLTDLTGDARYELAVGPGSFEPEAQLGAQRRVYRWTGSVFTRAPELDALAREEGSLALERVAKAAVAARTSAPDSEVTLRERTSVHDSTEQIHVGDAVAMTLTARGRLFIVVASRRSPARVLALEDVGPDGPVPVCSDNTDPERGYALFARPWPRAVDGSRALFVYGADPVGGGFYARVFRWDGAQLAALAYGGARVGLRFCDRSQSWPLRYDGPDFTRPRFQGVPSEMADFEPAGPTSVHPPMRRVRRY